MHCFVYASRHKPGSYLWLATQDDFQVLPESLKSLLGDLRFVLDVQLDDQRKLPVEDAALIMEHLRTQGWHMQVPPKEVMALANHPAYRQSLHDEPQQ